jgi:hypothetical protein
MFPICQPGTAKQVVIRTDYIRLAVDVAHIQSVFYCLSGRAMYNMYWHTDAVHQRGQVGQVVVYAGQSV